MILIWTSGDFFQFINALEAESRVGYNRDISGDDRQMVSVFRQSYNIIRPSLDELCSCDPMQHVKPNPYSSYQANCLIKACRNPPINSNKSVFIQ